MAETILTKIKLVRTGKCPACGKTEGLNAVCKTANTEVFRCPCGLEFIDPSLDEWSMAEIYRSSDLLKEVNPALGSYYEYDVLNPRTKTCRDYQEALTRLNTLLPAGRELLEVGCGTGGFLEFAARNGWSVTGLDSAPENVAKLKEKGLAGLCSPFLSYQGDKRFDAVVLWDLIEHPQDPASFIRKCHEFLREAGLVLIATPNYPNLLSEAAKFIYKLSFGKIAGPASKLYFLEHTSYFGEKTLGRLLKAEGFEVVSVWKTETDLERYQFSKPLRCALYVFFAAARILGLQNRLMMIARKSRP